MHSKMDVPKKSKRLIIWNGGSMYLSTSSSFITDVGRHILLEIFRFEVYIVLIV